MTTQPHNSRLRNARRRACRGGVAAVETALVAPLLILLLLGTIDVGQFTNTHSSVSDASRVGARVAARFTTTDTSDVEAAISSHLQKAFPGVPQTTLDTAVTIKVRNSSGATVTGNSLAAIPTGEPVIVEVALDFDAIRWISGLPAFDGQIVQAISIMRRE